MEKTARLVVLVVKFVTSHPVAQNACRVTFSLPAVSGFETSKGCNFYYVFHNNIFYYCYHALIPKK